MEGASVASASVDLSSFNHRWNEALGAPGSDAAADFETARAEVGAVWRSKSAEARSLRDAQYIAETDGVRFLNLGSDPSFLELEKQVTFMIVRPWYEGLYEKVAEKWSSPSDRVLVSGNAGTGKSWFQAFALRKLMQVYGIDLWNRS